ncbi:IPT/TIG domain-containing protein [Methanospirillum lacunae]|uniref:DUF1616 domain-containing protein n=1 Tax=Methanospirillum lacunae TaxID=668570 RepID=A0A2V2NF16_9EURY|nr:IPT/TIG domain-containing protein [Methanospirillum lacunae]PWR74181.1 hypothetical protein DK846_03245 [Methanospirillum lacunae]
MIERHDFPMWAGIILVILLTLTALVAYAYRFLSFENAGGAEFYLSILLVLSVILLLVFLTFTTVIFKYLGLSDPSQSLGLPEGSIRAVIALSLILIFMTSSILLYEEVEKHSGPPIYNSTNITQSQLDSIPKDEIVYIQRSIELNNGTLFNVGRKTEKSRAGEDIAKQIITTVSTLVVAVAGFYFGSKAVGVVGSGLSAVPLIRSINPTEGKRGTDIELKVFGKNFELVRDVTLVCDSIEIPCTDVTSNSTLIVCKLHIPDDSVGYPGGSEKKWAVVVKSSDIGEDTLGGVFTIIKEADTPAS